MRSLLLLLFSSLLLQGQSDFSNYQWQHFQILDQVRSAVATEDAIWFASPNFLSKVDKGNGNQIETGIAPLSATSFFRYDKLVVGNNDQVIVQQENYLVIQEQDEWIVQEVPSIFGLFKVDVLVRQEPDGSYLFTGPSIDIFRWKPGEQPSAAEDYQAPTPWRILKAQWSAPRQVLWVANGSKLGFVQGTIFTPIDLPLDSGPIIDLQVDTDGGLWLQTTQYILRWQNQSWTQHLLPQGSDPEQVSFAMLSPESALVVSPGKKTLLQEGINWFNEIDYSDALKDLLFDIPFLFDSDEVLWFINIESQKAVGQWKPEQEINWQTTNAWLPINKQLVHLNTDTENRIWITDGVKTYFYSAREWWPANRLYPNFPDSVRQIIFTKQCSPIVMTSTDPFGTNLPFRIQSWTAQGWVTLPDATVLPTVLSGAQHIFLDQQENLWVKLVFNTGYLVWNQGVWNTVLTTDFFPAPARLLSLIVTEEREQLIMSNLGRIRRRGQTYEQIPLTQLPFTEDTPILSAAAYSPTGTLWTAVNNEISRWPKDEEEELVLRRDEAGNDIGFFGLIGIHPFSDNDVWVINWSRGASHFNGKFWTLFDGSLNDLAYPRVHSMAKDDQGRLWFGAREGISVFTPEDRVVTTHEDLTHKSAINVIPNPACCQVQLRWQQTENERVQLLLHDSQGRQLRSILDQILSPGPMDLMVHRGNLPPGTYFLVRKSNGQLSSTPIIWK